VPHPNAARLAEGQKLLTRRGRIPTRGDVETNRRGVLAALHAKKVMPRRHDPEKEPTRCSRRSSWGGD